MQALGASGLRVQNSGSGGSFSNLLKSGPGLTYRPTLNPKAGRCTPGPSWNFAWHRGVGISSSYHWVQGVGFSGSLPCKDGYRPGGYKQWPIVRSALTSVHIHPDKSRLQTGVL